MPDQAAAWAAVADAAVAEFVGAAVWAAVADVVAAEFAVAEPADQGSWKDHAQAAGLCAVPGQAVFVAAGKVFVADWLYLARRAA